MVGRDRAHLGVARGCVLGASGYGCFWVLLGALGCFLGASGRSGVLLGHLCDVGFNAIYGGEG